MSSEEKSSLDRGRRSKREVLRTKTFRLIAMLSLTLMYFVIELVVGNITNSVALVADAFHMLSDVIALAIAIVAVRIARRRSDINTYGWVRAEVVGANINTVFLLALCLTIVFDAIRRFIQPEPIENVNLLLVVGSIGFGINIIGLFLFQGFHGHSHGGDSSHGHSHGSKKSHKKDKHQHNHSHDQGPSKKVDENLPDVEVLDDLTEDVLGQKFERHSTRALQEVIAECANQSGEPRDTVVEMEDDDMEHAHGNQKPKKKGSMNMYGVFLHVLADALGSVVVIISALLIKLVPHDPESKKHWTVYIDPTLSVLIVIIITISTIPLFKETSYILLQALPGNLEIKKVKEQLLESVPEIYGVHEFHIWRLTSDKVIASAHLHRRTLSDYMTVADKVKKFFHSIGIHSITIQYEIDEEPSTTVQRNLTVMSRPDVTTDEKMLGDCLLRCENVECDTQTCCTRRSDRSNTVVSNNATEIYSVTQPNSHNNPVFSQEPVTASEKDERF